MNEETADIHYQQGFNEGYIIAKHLPDLSDRLAQIENEAPRLEGFRDGRLQFALDQVREHRPAWMQPAREHDTDTNPPKDQDRELEER